MDELQTALIHTLHARTSTLRRLTERLPAEEASTCARHVTALENIAECAALLATAESDRDRSAAWIGLKEAVKGIGR